MIDKFKVGDRVRVVKRVEFEDDWTNSWVNQMDESIGKIFTISRISDHRGIRLEDQIWNFPVSSLELVAESNSDKQRNRTADFLIRLARHEPKLWEIIARSAFTYLTEDQLHEMMNFESYYTQAEKSA